MLIVTAFPSQNTMASIVAGVDIPKGKVADLDVAEAENATTTTATSSLGLPTEFGQSTLVIDDETEPDHVHMFHSG